MAPLNAAIADALEELGDLYELDGAIVHRVLAYRTGRGDGARVPGLGGRRSRGRGARPSCRGSGRRCRRRSSRWPTPATIPAAERLRAKFPPGLIAITRLPGLGPKRARLLYEQLGIDSPEALRDAAPAQRLRAVRGLGAKFEDESARGPRRAGRRGGAIDALPRERGGCCCRRDRARRGAGRGTARARADGRPRAARGLGAPAGGEREGHRPGRDHRRRPRRLAGALGVLEQIERVSASGPAGARGPHARRARAWTCGSPPRGSGATCCSTSPAPPRTTPRCASGRCARGCTSRSTASRTTPTGATRTCATEAEVYGLLGLALHRAGAAGEPGRAGGRAEARPADLIELGDIRGDLHCHTVASDGQATIEEMALAARELRLRVPGDHRPLRLARLRQRRLPGAAARADRAGRGGERARSRGSSCSPAAR